MIEIIGINEASRWDSIVRSFKEYDVYYLSGYVKPFFKHGDGVPYLLYYQAENVRAIYVYMLRSTQIDGYYDSISPYGYGGVLFGR